MPIKGADKKLHLFKYMPSYNTGFKTYEKTIPDQNDILDQLKITYQDHTAIIMDGGAIDICGKTAIISDRVITENVSSWTEVRPDVIERIKKILSLDATIVVPADPADFTGHVDGTVRFIDEKNVLINDMSNVDRKIKRDSSKHVQHRYNLWKSNFRLTLEKGGFNIHALVCGLHHNANDMDATGIYLNFLLLKELIVMPTYSNLEAENEQAKATLNKLYGLEVVTIPSDGIAKQGGVINCITWNE